MANTIERVLLMARDFWLSERRLNRESTMTRSTPVT
jgi:hypothetical protein